MTPCSFPRSTICSPHFLKLGPSPPQKWLHLRQRLQKPTHLGAGPTEVNGPLCSVKTHRNRIRKKQKRPKLYCSSQSFRKRPRRQRGTPLQATIEERGQKRSVSREPSAEERGGAWWIRARRIMGESRWQNLWLLSREEEEEGHQEP